MRRRRLQSRASPWRLVAGFGYPGNRRFGARLDFGFTRRLSETAPRIEFFGRCIHRAPLIV